jgi:hypothetical protein
MSRIRFVLPLLLALTAGRLPAADKDGFVPMFNGKDLSGWVNVNCAPGTFYVKDGMIITTGVPTGYLRTDKQYENFIAEFDWMHVPPKPDAIGNSGFFVWCDPLPAKGTGYSRGIEVQVLVNLEWKDKKSGGRTATSQGDLFSIWGARCVPDRPHPLGWERCIPSEDRAKGANEWNHYRVEANDGVIKLAVNGKVVSGVSKCNPRKGYLALESEGSECRFKNLRIKELPSTNPKPKEIGKVAKNFKSMYTGIDLSGWKASEGVKGHWRPSDWRLVSDGKGKDLVSEKEYGDFEMICDFHWTRKPADESSSIVLRRDTTEKPVSMPLAPNEGWNRYHIRLKGDELTVHLNGKKLIEKRQQTGVALRGAIALHNEGTPVEFANLFIRPLGKDE